MSEFKVIRRRKPATVEEMTRQLDLLGINPRSKNKTEVWEIYSQCFGQLEHYMALEKSKGNLWKTRNGLTNLFCKALLVAGNAGLLMKDVMKAKWNPENQTFYDKCKALIAQGYVVKEGERFLVTQKGIENSPC